MLYVSQTYSTFNLDKCIFLLQCICLFISDTVHNITARKYQDPILSQASLNSAPAHFLGEIPNLLCPYKRMIQAEVNNVTITNKFVDNDVGLRKDTSEIKSLQYT